MTQMIDGRICRRSIVMDEKKNEPRKGKDVPAGVIYIRVATEAQLTSKDK